MNSYQVTLRLKQQLAEGTFAFHFSRPAGFAFVPGQAVKLTLPSEGDERLAHVFSLVAAPAENELVIATRMRDSRYKQVLGELKEGAEATLAGPFGSLTLPEDTDRAAVLVAGGIGITPFVSMVRQMTHDESARQLVLVYSNRRPEDAAFLDELEQLEQQNPNFRLVATMTAMDKSQRSWEGSSKRIDAELVKAAAAQLDKPAYYLAGPPLLVDAIREMLAAAGIAEEDLHDEGFYGY